MADRSKELVEPWTNPAFVGVMFTYAVQTDDFSSGLPKLRPRIVMLMLPSVGDFGGRTPIGSGADALNSTEPEDSEAAGAVSASDASRVTRTTVSL